MRTCRACGKPFSSYVVIDGKAHFTSKRKFCYECSPFGGGNRRDLSHIADPKTRSECARCKQTKPLDEFYSRGGKLNNRPFSYCIACEKLRQAANSRTFKLKCLAYKGVTGCERCGYSKSLAALDFHHIDRAKKLHTITNLRRRFTDWTVTTLELDKCLVLCANCHREEHEEGGAGAEN